MSYSFLRGAAEDAHEAAHLVLAEERSGATPVETTELDPTRERARVAYSRGQEAFNAGRHEAALAFFTEAYGIIPNAIVLIAIGASLERLGRKDEALEKYRQYLQADPTGPQAANAQEGVNRIVTTEGGGAATVGPKLNPPSTPYQGGAGIPSWVPWTIVGGGVVLAAGVYFLMTRKKRPASVKANRRRRRR